MTSRWGSASSERAVLAICVAAGFTTLLDQAVFTLAVPSLRDDLGASAAQIQLILSVFSITFGIALVPAGRLGDIIGRRGLFLAGVTLFSAFSFVGGFATSADAVILARLLQGIGGGIVNTQVMGLIQDLFQGLARTRALGAYAAASGLSGAAGPLIGGALLTLLPGSWGWRSLFLINVPFGVAVIIAAFRFLPRASRTPAQGRTSIDSVGLALLTVFTVTAILSTLVVEDGGGQGQLLVAAGASIVLFVGWEVLSQRRGGSPVLSSALLGSPGYLLGSAVAMCKFASGLTIGAVSALFFLDGLGVSALLFGALAIPRSVGMLASSARSWRFAQRWGRPGVTAAIFLTAAITVMDIVAVLLLPTAWIITVLFITGAFQGVLGGLIQAPNQGMTLDAVNGDDVRGVAAGFLQLVQRLMSAIGVALGMGIFLRIAGTGAELDAYRLGFAAAVTLAVGFSVLAGVAALADALRRGLHVSSASQRTS